MKKIANKEDDIIREIPSEGLERLLQNWTNKTYDAPSR